MATVRSYQDLLAWQRAMDMAVAAYECTRRFPREEIYGLSSQLRRAAVSVPSNIAEGQGRLTTGEFRHFLGIARGSTCELQSQLQIARRLGFGSTEALDNAENLSHEIGKMIFTILKKLNT